MRTQCNAHGVEVAAYIDDIEMALQELNAVSVQADPLLKSELLKMRVVTNDVKTVAPPSISHRRTKSPC